MDGDRQPRHEKASGDLINLDQCAPNAATERIETHPCAKVHTMSAIIYQRPKNAMQSGRARTDEWVLEFAPAAAKTPDPLMGWAGSTDTTQQLKLTFADVDAAKAYAAKNGIDVQIVETPKKTLKLQAYADNFR